MMMSPRARHFRHLVHPSAADDDDLEIVERLFFQRSDARFQCILLIVADEDDTHGRNGAGHPGSGNVRVPPRTLSCCGSDERNEIARTLKNDGVPKDGDQTEPALSQKQREPELYVAYCGVHWLRIAMRSLGSSLSLRMASLWGNSLSRRRERLSSKLARTR
jgi:hypothetical protein